MRHYFYYAIIVIMACVSTVSTHAANKLTPNARLALLQKQVAIKSSHQVNAKSAIADIRLVVEVDAREATNTFEQIRKAGGTVLSKLGHQAVISIPADRVDNLAAIDGVKTVDATHRAEVKTDVTRNETGVS